MSDIVGHKDLPNAIALNSSQFNLARTIGPVVGAFALKFLGTAGCFYANALSFLGVIFAIRMLPKKAKTRQHPATHETFWQSMQEGFRYIGSNRALFWLLLTLAMSSLFGVPIVTLLPIFARDVLGRDASGLGLLVASFGLGAMMAGFLLAYLGDFSGKGRFVLRAFGVFALSVLSFSASQHLWVSAVCLWAAGASMVSFASVLNTLVQTNVPDHLRGRAMSAFIFCFGGCMPFGSLIAGIMARAMGAPIALAIQALILGAFTAFVALTQPASRRLR
jgi:MFS family permease